MEQNELFSFDEFLHEAKKAKIKRKYTNNHPEQTVQFKTPVRNKILSFISEKEIVSKADLEEFIKGMNEDSGRKTTFDWIRRNSKMIKKVAEKNGNVSYKLTKFGQSVLSKTTINEEPATLQNTPGMGNVKTASGTDLGSGDCFIDDEEDKKKKKKKMYETETETIENMEKFVDDLIDDEQVPKNMKIQILKTWLETIKTLKSANRNDKTNLSRILKKEEQIKKIIKT